MRRTIWPSPSGPNGSPWHVRGGLIPARPSFHGVQSQFGALLRSRRPTSAPLPRAPSVVERLGGVPTNTCPRALLHVNNFGAATTSVSLRSRHLYRQGWAGSNVAIGVVDYAGHEPELRLSVTVTTVPQRGENGDHDIGVDSLELLRQ